MGDSIRTALERLVEALEDYEPIWGGFPESALAAARAALAESQGEGPSDELESVACAVDPEHQGEDRQMLHVFYSACMSEGGTADEMHLRGLRAVLARWGHQPAPHDDRGALPIHDDRGVLPMIVSETGACDEPETERIICACISGGADYVNNMPRTLTLERINSEGSTYQKYIQDPTPVLAVHPAPQPPAEGEAPRYEFSVYDADYVEQAGGSAPTYAQALSEGQRYLARYQQDGPHTLELRRVEVLHSDALGGALAVFRWCGWWWPSGPPPGGGGVMNKETVRYSVEHDYIKRETTYSVTINDRAVLLMDLDPLDRVILDSKIESAADFAQSLEIVLRAIERGMAIERDMAELKLEVE